MNKILPKLNQKAKEKTSNLLVYNRYMVIIFKLITKIKVHKLKID